MKKTTWILLAVALLAVVLAPSMALANNGPHGGYVSDTDLCAQCHRAHTAPSSITWTDNQGAQKNALLLTDSGETYLFCLACHDTASQGADTNVTGGVYEGTQFGGETTTALISGAFGSVNAAVNPDAEVDSHNVVVTSKHLYNGRSWGAYGGGLFGVSSSEMTSTDDPRGTAVELPGTGNKIVMSCTTCHDPHGSSNYRILKDTVNGNTVGGYDGTAVGIAPFGGRWSAQNPKPIPFVISNERNYPQGGFQLHIKYPRYDPDYTVANYAKAPAGDTSKGMTGWCVGCHTTYNDATRGSFTGGTPPYTNPDYVFSSDSPYNAEGIGTVAVARHRHPMNVPLSNYAGPSTMVTNTATGLPLDHPVSEQLGGKQYTASDWVECLTCHNAHGSTATMTGWSNLGDPAVEEVVGSRGVMPVDSNLLKMNNRAVCEACHNK